MSEDIKTQIVTKARDRFAHYGFAKTSMVEIAKDCDMSVGGLYRFYKNKEAIAVAGTDICLKEKAEKSEIAAADQSNSKEKISAYMLQRLLYMHEFVSGSPHMHEMVELISTRHADVLQTYEDRSVGFLAAIIEEGIKTGHFRVIDSADVAADIYRATMMFNMPICMQAPLELMSQQLESLLELLFEGLESKHE